VNGTVKFLTKGDNNSVDDRGLYAPGQLWLTKKDVVGRARGFLPYVGLVTIYMNEYPKFKVSRRTTVVYLFKYGEGGPVKNHLLHCSCVVVDTGSSRK
jgi:hypothetical protein